MCECDGLWGYDNLCDCDDTSGIAFLVVFTIDVIWSRAASLISHCLSDRWLWYIYLRHLHCSCNWLAYSHTLAHTHSRTRLHAHTHAHSVTYPRTRTLTLITQSPSFPSAYNQNIILSIQNYWCIFIGCPVNFDGYLTPFSTPITAMSRCLCVWSTPLSPSTQTRSGWVSEWVGARVSVCICVCLSVFVWVGGCMSDWERERASGWVSPSVCVKEWRGEAMVVMIKLGLCKHDGRGGVE